MNIADTSEKGKRKIDGAVPFCPVGQVPPRKRGRPPVSKYDPVIEAATLGSIVIHPTGDAEALAAHLRNLIKTRPADVRVHVRGDAVYLEPIRAVANGKDAA